MRRRFTLGSIALLIALVGAMLVTASAFAHETRKVGKYTFVVGFLNEPTYANQPNSLDFTICNGSSCNFPNGDDSMGPTNPVTGAEKTLNAEVSMGGSTPLKLDLEPRDGMPGKYTGYFLPTKTGDYTFHIFGTLNGDKIDEKFTSSPTTFDPVDQIQTYPSASSANDPVATLQSQVQNAQSTASTAMTVGIIGGVLGILGLGVAAFALARKSKESSEGLGG